MTREVDPMRRLMLLSLMCLVLAPSSAGAVTLVNADGTSAEPYQSWANSSRMPTPDRRVFVFDPDTKNAWNYCGGEGPACASNGVVPSISFVNADSIRPSVFLHEMGHVYDYSMPERKRRAFFEITGYGPAWRGGANSASERFAEAYSLCARGVRNVGKRWSGKTYLGRWTGGYAYSPRSPQVHHAVCRMIATP